MGIRSNDFTSLSDDELDHLVQNVVSLHPQSGEKTVVGQLRSQGIKIQRERVRQSLRRVDPTGIESQARKVLHRRVYQVSSPNSLWHCDGYHKLIRWNMVIHGAIDGYSRLIMYLKVSSNNRARTVLSAFNSAVQEYGLPSRLETLSELWILLCIHVLEITTPTGVGPPLPHNYMNVFMNAFVNVRVNVFMNVFKNVPMNEFLCG